MKSYLFISNSSKPTEEKLNSRDKIVCGNVSKPCLQAALDFGYKVFFGVNRNKPEELACSMPVTLYDSHTYRSLTDFKSNRIAFRNLMKVLKENSVEVIHCNTPVGGLMGRVCGKLCGVKKVIYTAHGFHFYKGAPLFNRTILKWAEHLMAHWTDAIITMNEEDFQAAKKMKLRKGGKVYFVPGVGIDTALYGAVEVDAAQKRKELGLKDSDVVLISMGDLIPRKNYETAIRAIAKTGNDKLHYLICGRGPEFENLKALAEELGIASQIHLLGFRTDIKELVKVANIFLFTTLQEGLPRSMMEAMASGLPCVASNIRGNVDLIEDGVNGFLCPPTDVEGFSTAISRIADDPALQETMKQNNLEKIQGFDVSVVAAEIKNIYNEVLMTDQGGEHNA